MKPLLNLFQFKSIHFIIITIVVFNIIEVNIKINTNIKSEDASSDEISSYFMILQDTHLQAFNLMKSLRLHRTFFQLPFQKNSESIPITAALQMLLTKVLILPSRHRHIKCKMIVVSIQNQCLCVLTHPVDRKTNFLKHDSCHIIADKDGEQAGKIK